MIELLKVVLIVIVILFLVKKKWDLGLVLFLGTLLTGLIFRLNLKVFSRSMLEALTSRETFNVIGIILLVLYLGNLLRIKGNFKKMVYSNFYYCSNDFVV